MLLDIHESFYCEQTWSVNEQRGGDEGKDDSFEEKAGINYFFLAWQGRSHLSVLFFVVEHILLVQFVTVQADFVEEGDSRHYQEGNHDRDEVENLEKAEEPHPPAHEGKRLHFILAAVDRGVEVD